MLGYLDSGGDLPANKARKKLQLTLLTDTAFKCGSESGSPPGPHLTEREPDAETEDSETSSYSTTLGTLLG